MVPEMHLPNVCFDVRMQRCRKTAVLLESELDNCLISANLCFLSSLGAPLRKANQLQLRVQAVLGLKARRVLRPKRYLNQSSR